MGKVGAGDGPHHTAIITVECVAAISADGNVGRILAEVGLNGGSHEVAAAGDADAELLGLGVGAEEVGVRLFVGEAEGEGGNEA